MKSSEFFPDGQDTVQIENHTVRKGTIGAFIQNALVLRDNKLDIESRQSIVNDIISSLASMKATKVFDVFEIRDPELRKLVDQHLEELSPARISR